MTEEIGLIVRAKIKGDPGGMDKLKGDVGKATGEGAKKGLLNFKLPGILGGGADKSAESKGSTLGGAATAGAVGGLVGGAVIGGLQSIQSILQKMFDLLAESSPMLNASLKLIWKSIMLFLLPIGNVIAALLRPFVRSFIEASVANMKSLRAGGPGVDLTSTITTSITKMLEALVPVFSTIAAQVMPAIVLGLATAFVNVIPQFLPQLLLALLTVVPLIIGGLIVAAALFEIVTEAGMVIAGAVFGALMLVGATIAALGWPVLLVIGLAALVVTLIAMFGPQIWGFLVSLGEGIYNAIQGIPAALMGIGSMIYNGIAQGLGDLGSALGGFGTWLWNQITNAIGGLGGALSNIGTSLYNWVYDSIASIFNGIHNFSISILGFNVQPFTAIPEIALLSEGGTMTSEGLAYLHPGEVVKDKGDIKSMIGDAVRSAGGGGRGGDTHVHLNIKGDVNDGDKFVKKVNKAFKQQMSTMNTR